MNANNRCPFAEGVRIYHESATSALTPLFYYRLSFRQPSTNTNRAMLFLHCKVVVCSKRGGRQLEGYANVSLHAN